MATKTVPVISWVYWNGDEQGGGGFDWFLPHVTESDLLTAFEHEKAAWACWPSRVRWVNVPDVPADLDGQALTDYLDGERLDDIEVNLPAVRVAIVGEVCHAV